ncbi:MAG TPA: ABC transporter substrate-binding protein [Stellaceae bacterium]|nr:ABC transporter substrate-binding protein [Stellaceae bacterium]
MTRRKFIYALGGASLLRQRAFAAEQHIRHIAWLSGLDADDPQIVANRKALVKGLRDRGLSEGQDYAIEFHSALGNTPDYATLAARIIATKPDLVLTSGDAALPAVLSATKSIPVVFVQVNDPVSLGFVPGLARPNGNATGFTQFPPSIGGKWLQLLKDVAPKLRRVGIWSFDSPAARSNLRLLLPPIRQAAASLGIDAELLDVQNVGEISQAIARFSGSGNGGLLFPPEIVSLVHRQQIARDVAAHGLPAIYPYQLFVESGGLMSYSSDPADAFYKTGDYVYRILNGAKPGDLPVQEPTRFQLVVNTKAAKAIDLTIPNELLTTADEVIE